MIRRLASLFAIGLVVAVLCLGGAAAGVGLGYWYATSTPPSEQALTTAGTIALAVAILVLVVVTAFYARQAARLVAETRRARADALSQAREDRQQARYQEAYLGVLGLLWDLRDWATGLVGHAGSGAPLVAEVGPPAAGEFRRRLMTVDLLGSAEVRSLLDDVDAAVAELQSTLAMRTAGPDQSLPQSWHEAVETGGQALLAGIRNAEDRMRTELQLE